MQPRFVPRFVITSTVRGSSQKPEFITLKVEQVCVGSYTATTLTGYAAWHGRVYPGRWLRRWGCYSVPPGPSRSRCSEAQCLWGFRAGQQCRLWFLGGYGPSTTKSSAHGESPRARNLIALAPSITAWQVAY